MSDQPSVAVRFWSKVHKIDGGCWLWTASTIRGYGQIAVVVNGRRRPAYAHRLSYEFAHGPIPAGLSVCHTCDVPLCVNPDHLFLGTQQENLADARAKGRLDESRPKTRVFTPAQRLEIFSLPARRGLVVELARQFGVTKACISLIRRGRFKRPQQPFDPHATGALARDRDAEILNRTFERVPYVHIPVRGVVSVSLQEASISIHEPQRNG